MNQQLYVLRLAEGKFYVGKSANVDQRYVAHLNGTGAAWTRRYRPIELVRTEPCVSPFDEDRLTKELMAEHGIDAVRGGTYCQFVIGDLSRRLIQREIWGAQGACLACGSREHLVGACSQIVTAATTSSRRRSCCQWIGACLAAFFRVPEPAEDPLIPTGDKQGPSVPSAPPPREVQQGLSVPLPPAKKPTYFLCERCGRNTHSAKQCFAKTHLRGTPLSV